MCADEKELAINMLTAAFFANHSAGCLFIRKAEHKSILQDDPFLVSFGNFCQSPKDILEHRLFSSNKKRIDIKVTLYYVFKNIYPRPVYDSPWRVFD